MIEIFSVITFCLFLGGLTTVQHWKHFSIFSFKLCCSSKVSSILISGYTEGPACTLFLPIESFPAGTVLRHSSVFTGPSGVGVVHIVRQRVTACYTQSHRRCSSLCASLPFARLLGFAADQREAEWERAGEVSLWGFASSVPAGSNTRSEENITGAVSLG